MYKGDLTLNNLQWLICHKIQATILEIETHKILCDLKIQTDHIEDMNQKKRTKHTVAFTVAAHQRVKVKMKVKEGKKTGRIPG